MNLGKGQEINGCIHDEEEGEVGKKGRAREMMQRENGERIKWRRGGRG